MDATTTSKDEVTKVVTNHVDKENAVATKNDITKAITTPQSNGLSAINLFDEKELAVVENFLTKIVRSEKGGIKSVNDGLAILMRAKDFDLPFSSCIEHVHVINGKTGIDVHLIKALLLRAGCRWECTKDYQPLYEYTDGINVYNDGSFPQYVVRCVSKAEAEKKRVDDKEHDAVYVWPVKWYADFNGNKYRDYQLNNNYIIINTKQEAIAAAQQKKIGVYRIANQPIDFITEYKIYRNIVGKECFTIGHFSFSDAQKAEMFSKDTYIKYARILVGHRAFTYAARDIGSDLLMGVMETNELKMVTNTPINEQEFIEAEVI